MALRSSWLSATALTLTVSATLSESGHRTWEAAVHCIRTRLLFVGMLWLIVASSAWSATASATPDRPLRVVTKAIAPFVLPNTNPLAGFSIDLWNEVARGMQVKFEWKWL